MTPEDFQILQHMMNGAAPPDFAVRLLEDICKRTGLDWKARHVYLQKRRTKTGEAWQAVLSIDGFRAVGASHPDYAGQEGPFWTTAADGTWTDIPPEAKPYAAKVGIKKKDGIVTWGVVKYADYYAGMMWDKFATTMSAKCAEMLAWRKTFPRVFGGLYGDAEMEQASRGKNVVLGEEDVAKNAPASPAEEYKVDLLACETGDQVLALGKKIQTDRRVKPEETIELHAIYTRMKKKYENV